MKSIRKILASMRNADQKFSLILPKDRIAVGISGGKDSEPSVQAESPKEDHPGIS